MRMFCRYFKLLELKLSMKFSDKYRVGTRENSKDKTASLRSVVMLIECLGMYLVCVPCICMNNAALFDLSSIKLSDAVPH